MTHPLIFNSPKRGPFQGVLEPLNLQPWISRWQRIRRKRFIHRIQEHSILPELGALARHPSGQRLLSALDSWLEHPPLGGKTFLPVSAENTPDRKRCSVIVNTAGRASELSITLGALRSQWNAQDDELIVVIGPGDRDSHEVASECGMVCRILDCPELNLAVSRNLGWQAAEGRFLAFIDDDASPADGWLDALLAPFEAHPEAGVTAGFILDGHGNRFLNRYVIADTMGRSYHHDALEAAEAGVREIGTSRAFLTATGCNMAIRRDALHAIGGFDPAYPYFLEETDVVLRIKQLGLACVPAAASRVYHRLAPNLARDSGVAIEQRVIPLLSQMHFISKFGLADYPPEEIRNQLCRRIILDLEKIAWTSEGAKQAAAHQNAYLDSASHGFAARTIASGT